MADTKDMTPEQLRARVIELEKENEKYKKLAENKTCPEKNVAFDLALSGIGIARPDGTIVDVNEAFLGMTGYTSKDDVIGKKIEDFANPPEIMPKVIEEIRRNGFSMGEGWMNKSGGESIDIIYKVTISTDDQGRPEYMLASFLDITELKTKERDVLENQATIRSFYDNTPMMMGVVEFQEDDLTFVSANNATAKFYDTTPENLFFRPAKDIFIPQQYVDIWLKNLKILQETGRPVNFFYEREINDSKIWLSVTLAPIESSSSDNRYSFIIEDISGRIETESELTESKDRYKKLSNLTFEGIILHKNAIALDANQSLLDMVGYKHEEIIGKNLIQQLVYPEDYDIVREHVIQDRTNPYEIRAIKKDGTVFPVELEARNVKYKGEIFRVVAVRDITSRKEAERLLQESKHRLRSLIDASPDIICFKDGKGRWLEANRADLELFELTDVDYYGKTDTELAEYADFYKEAFLACEDSDEIAWQKGDISRGEEIIPKPGAEDRVYDIIKVPLYNEDSSRKGLVVLGRDVTEYRNAEKALASSEKLYRNLFENAPIGICTFNRRGKVLEANQELVRLLGSPSIEATKNVNMLEFPMLRKAGITDDFLKCFETGERVSAVRYYTSKWGRTIYLRYIVSPIQDEAGSVTQVQALVEDYTEKKNAEDALLRSEQRYRNLFETMVQGVFYQNRDGYITNANQAALEILGVSEEEIRQRSIFSNDWKAIDENGKALMPEEYPSMKAISTGSEVENIILGIFNKKDEEFRWLSVSAKPQFTTDKGKSNEAFVTMHDITARKRAEIELRNSEERFQALIEQAPDAIYMHDSDGRIVLFNKKASQMTGYSADQLRQMHISNLEIKYSLEELKEKWNRLLHQKSMRIEGLHKRQNGDIFPVDVNLSFMQIHGRTLIIGFARDISDRKRTENALRESEEKYRKLVDNSLLGFYLIRKGILLYCNKTFADIFGYDQSELINSPVRKCIADESWNKVAQELRLREEGIKDYSQYELHGVRKNGEIIDCEAFGRRIDYQGKPAVQGIIIDITEKNKSREELQKIARLESLGVLAGGIAHNFKNMLTSMSLSVELGRIKRKRIDEYLDKLEKSIAQATALANRFQSFSRGGDPVKEMININQIVEEAVSLSLSGSNITADMQLDPHLWETAADPRQMHEVFTNLIINARQAMPKGGNINIETHNARQQIEEGETPGEANMIKIVVEDQGIGIPKDIINNIFDPFFTTKEEGHGLGLASVHYIIRKHGGTIRASSKMGVGARFDIYLPAIVESQNETEDNIIQENYFDEPVNVLLMDDNADIRENLIDFGEEFNLKITGVANGSQCLEKYKEAIEKDKKFEVVILDLTIEGSKEGGLDTLRQLQKIDENVKAIVFSGHSSLPVVANYEDYGFAGCLEKPINIDHFCKEIQKIVEE